jgi:hypothetical protein
MSILGYLTGTNSARKHVAAAGDQSRVQLRGDMDYIDQLYAPLRQSGQRAFGTLQDIAGLNGQGAQQNWYDQYVASPDVQTRTNEGIRTIDNSYAGRTGGTLSGGLMKALTRFGIGQATGDINNKIGLIERISNTGNNAIGQTANARLGIGGQIANSFTNEGNQMANADLADGSFLSNLINSVARGAGSLGFNPFGSSSAPIDINQRASRAWDGYR